MQSYELNKRCHFLLSSLSVKNIEATDKDGEPFMITVDNLFLCKSAVGLKNGDSGGLLHDGQRIVGLIVAKADEGVVLIHPIMELLELAADETGVRLEIE